MIKRIFEIWTFVVFTFFNFQLRLLFYHSALKQLIVMFRSTKKLEDPPKVMTMQEIMEDLETFKINPKIINRQQLLSDVKAKNEEEITNQSLLEWWEGFEVNQLQIKDLENTAQRLDQLKQSLREQANEIEQQKSALINEAEANLMRIRTLKAPDE